MYKQKDLGYMSEEVFYKSLEKAFELGYSKLNFTPTTGELLLHEKWSEFVQTALNDNRTKSVYFYSNAILLSDEAIDKIISFENIHKISAIFFSIGGVDQASYNLMYGVNKFETVCANIDALCSRLKSKGVELQINCELRIPKNIKPDLKEMSTKLNSCGYTNFHIDYIDHYDNIGGMIDSKELNFLPKKDKIKPCYRLNDVRFDIHGNIWACGCVVTEQQGNEELIIGNVNEDAKEIKTKHIEIFEKWDKTIPKTCKECRLYKSVI